MKKLLLLAVSVALMSNAWAGGDAAQGKAAVEKYGCIACHGADFKSPIDPTYPKLAGQHQDYRVNAIMNGQAKPLTNTDIQNITAYISNLPGTLVMQK